MSAPTNLSLDLAPPLHVLRVPSGPVLSQTVVRPSRGWQLINVRELWRFRELIGFLAWRDVKVRYKQTLLGAAWAVLQPAMMMVVFTIFFGRLANVSSGALPYPLFVYAGLLPWFFFSSAITSAGHSVVGSERLLTKIYFPRMAIPLAAVGAAVVDFWIAFVLLIGLMAWYGVAPGPEILAIPLVFIAILLAATGVGMMLAALNVAYRDFRYVIPFLVQIWMFATPTIYMHVSAEPSGWLAIVLAANPMTSLIASFRATMVGATVPWNDLMVSSACAAGIFIAGCFYFRRVEDSFADIV